MAGTLRAKRLPMYSFENDRLFGRSGPRTRRYDGHGDENLTEYTGIATPRFGQQGFVDST